MIGVKEFVLRAQIDDIALMSWIEAGWLLPNGQDGSMEFTEIDLARAQLIQDLNRDMGLNDEGISVALDLVDQIHGVRRALRELLDAVRAQSADTQGLIFSAVRRSSDQSQGK